MINKIKNTFLTNSDLNLKLLLLWTLALIGPFILLFYISKIAVLTLIILMASIHFNPTNIDLTYVFLIGSLILSLIIVLINII